MELPQWRTSPELWAAASIQGLNRFITAGVIAATIALLVQNQLSTRNFVLGVATITGALTATRTIFGVLAAPLAGTVSDKLGNRWIVTNVGLVIGAVGMTLMSRADPVIILSGILLVAVTAGSLQALTTTIAGDSANQTNRGRAIGFLHTSGDLGSALGPPAAYALLPFIGLSGVYLGCAGLFALGLILTLGYTRKNSKSTFIKPKAE